MTYTKTFFVTYKAFVTPQVLLPKLLQRFHVPTDETPAIAKTIQVRTINALLKWLELAPNDWDTDLVNQLDSFVLEITPSNESLAKKLQNAIVDVVRLTLGHHSIPSHPPLSSRARTRSDMLSLFLPLLPPSFPSNGIRVLPFSLTLMPWRWRVK